MWNVIRSNWFLAIIFILVFLITALEIIESNRERKNRVLFSHYQDSLWLAPNLNEDPNLTVSDKEMILYGEDLIANTAKYLGPRGTVAAITNGMNCQNCHLEAGTRPWGNNYGAVSSTYPRFRERSGTVETIYKRVNDCLQRSLNGEPLDSGSREMQAIAAYIKWLGKDVPSQQRPPGSGLGKLPYLSRAADPEKGRLVYKNNCSTCHGDNGEGQKTPGSTVYTNPPLWGENSYNTAAGLFRLSNFAFFVKNNMPFGKAYHDNHELLNEEAWDVAAFVNSQPRPHKIFESDWPDISKKPVDHPFGPFNDTFPEAQHKYGPWIPIVAWREVQKK
jgi:thiosulfate dehydrogenase